jgi:O-methyltransferase involved in polyketide biosynthesis
VPFFRRLPGDGRIGAYGDHSSCRRKSTVYCPLTFIAMGRTSAAIVGRVGIDVNNLTTVERTALLTLYIRALDSRAHRPILGDRHADATVREIDYDFAALGIPASVVCLTALRTKLLDDRVRAFTTRHPDAVVLDLGAGLDSRIHRVEPAPTVDWYNVDLPAVIAVRDAMLPPDREHSVGASLADENWPDLIPRRRPAILIADGLLAFMAEQTTIRLFRQIANRFPDGEFAFNDYGRMGWFSRLGMRVLPQRMFSDIRTQWGYAGFKDAHHPETWTQRLTLVEEASYAHQPEVSLFPGALRRTTRLAGRFKATARRGRILRYRILPQQPSGAE